jgi:hypothetical protein
MPAEVVTALKIVLDHCSKDCFARGELDSLARLNREHGRNLLRALSLVEDWCVRPDMGPDAIRDSLAQSDRWWEEWLDEAA